MNENTTICSRILSYTTMHMIVYGRMCLYMAVQVTEYGIYSCTAHILYKLYVYSPTTPVQVSNVRKAYVAGQVVHK